MRVVISKYIVVKNEVDEFFQAFSRKFTSTILNWVNHRKLDSFLNYTGLKNGIILEF